MRILQVTSLYPPVALGGAETYAHELTEALVARGHDVGVVTLGVPGPRVVAEVPAWPYRLDAYADQPRWRKALFHVRDVYDPVTRRDLARAIKRFGPDVIHSHSVAGLSVAALLTHGPARVHHLHDYWLLCQRTSMFRDGADCADRCTGCAPISAARLGLLRRRPPRFVAVSQAVLDLHRRFAPWLEGVVVPLPAEPPAERPPTAAHPRPVLGFIGQWTEQKGVHLLLEAFARLEPGAAVLRFAGAGPLEHEIRGAGAGVEAVGRVDGRGREAFFASLDALVVPSIWREPGGLVLQEARARGITAISADVGGLTDSVDVAARPLLFPAGDVDALADRLRSFLADPGRYAMAGPPPPTWPMQAEVLEGVYEGALAARAASTD